MASAASAIGGLTKKPSASRSVIDSQPPSAGPSAVVIAVAPDQVPIARPRVCSGNVAADQREAAGHEQRRADALDGAREDQIAESPCASPHHADAPANTVTPSEVHAPPAVAIAKRAADEQQRGEERRVGLDHPLDVGHALRRARAAGRATRR